MNKLSIKKVSIQGGAASFSHTAASQLYEVEQFLHRDSFAAVFADLDSGEAELAVVPIENSTYGSVYENYDHLSASGCKIVAEVYVPVRLCLAGLADSSLTNIKTVHSHQVALGQIRNFQSQHPDLKFLPHADTAGAAETVAVLGDLTVAACASRPAVKLHGLKILADRIEDNSHNFTRFFAISRQPLAPANSQPTKTTVQFELGTEAGSLYKSLRSFADRDLALSRIESRPIINTNWNYRFYLDINAADNSALEHALAEMKTYVKDGQVDILGCYPSINLQA